MDRDNSSKRFLYLRTKLWIILTNKHYEYYLKTLSWYSDNLVNKNKTFKAHKTISHILIIRIKILLIILRSSMNKLQIKKAQQSCAIQARRYNNKLINKAFKIKYWVWAAIFSPGKTTRPKLLRYQKEPRIQSLFKW